MKIYLITKEVSRYQKKNYHSDYILGVQFNKIKNQLQKNSKNKIPPINL